MTTRAPPNDLYFVNPAVDAFFMGVASVLCFLYFHLTLTGYGAVQVSEQALSAAALLSWVGNWPHFSATSYRLYQSRGNIRQFPLTAFLIPLLVTLATIACYVFPVSFAPYFVKLFVLWSPYHFSLQTLGITLIYARRANLKISRLTRHSLTIFFLSSFLVQYSETEISMKTAFMFAMAYPQLNLPAFTPTLFTAVMYLSLAVIAYELLPQLMSAGRRFPWIVLLPLFTQYLWFVHSARDFSFQLLVPFFHALQYILIAWSVEIHTANSGRRLLHTSRWALVNIAFGGFFFFGLPRLLVPFGWNLDFSLLIIAAAVSLHHYFVDGVIWKLKRESPHSPLFTNVARATSEGT